MKKSIENFRYKKVVGVVSIFLYVFGLTTVRAMDIGSALCKEGSTSAPETVSLGRFTVVNECVSGSASTTYMMRGHVVDKDAFLKAFEKYKTYGDVCESVDVTGVEQSVGGHAFTRTCELIGSYPLYFIDGRRIATFALFLKNMSSFESGDRASSTLRSIEEGMLCDLKGSTTSPLGGMCARYSTSSLSVPTSTTRTSLSGFLSDGVRVSDALCGEKTFGTTTYRFASTTFMRVCGKNDIVGKVYMDGERVSISSFIARLGVLSKGDTPRVSVASSTTSEGVRVGTSPVTECAIPLLSWNTLRVGSSGGNVYRIQERLHTFGILKVSPNGYYGQMTKNAVIQFQKEEELATSGVVTKRVVEAMNRRCSSL